MSSATAYPGFSGCCSIPAGQGCSMLNALIVQDPVELEGVVVEGGADIGLAVVA